MHNKEIEDLKHLLRRAGPILAAIDAPERRLSETEKAKKMKMLAHTSPFLHELTPEEMRGLLLKLLAQRNADGQQLMAWLSKANFKVKDSVGGAIYPLLFQLEAAGLIHCEKKVRGGRIIYEYQIQPKGRCKLDQILATTPALPSWYELVSPLQA